jgi:UDP-N-acetylmuramate: L-alanyl-gamma-D-glutamyl-meso-diaminopimelate ligase
MRVHVIAVAGTGMGALAGLLQSLGHDVTGSDVAFDPPMGPALKAWGIECKQGFEAAHLEPRPDLVVVGNVCRKENPEAVAAFERGMDVTHIGGALRRLVLPATSPLVVAGTHGKTTTSAMAAHLLEAAGRTPGFLIGGLPKNFRTSFRAPQKGPRRLNSDGQLRQPPFVIEGDEYDTAYFEKTAKFLHYQAEVAIITSIEHDHIDIYPTEESYLDAFRRFVSSIPKSGLIVANAADRRVVDIVAKHAVAEVAWYALQDEDTHGYSPHWLAAPVSSDERGTVFELFAGGVACGRCTLSAAGRHNLKNALAAIGAVAQGYGARLAVLGAALSEFAGVGRRQDLVGSPRGIFVYDDFAHHPTAVHETLLAFRQKHPAGRLFAVFEPRSATACRNIHQAAYESCWGAADEIHLAPLGRDLPPDERLDTAKIAAALRAQGKVATAHTALEGILEQLVQRARPGDVIALLSNGAFGGIHDRLVRALG